MFKTIVIGFDGSPDGERALDLATSMASEAAARLILVHVTEVVGGKGGLYPMAADDDLIKESVAGQAAQLRAGGFNAVAVTETIRIGGPAHVIADIAESENADLIVVGTRGRSMIGEVVLGSVPIRLLHIAHRPVLVVPPPIM